MKTTIFDIETERLIKPQKIHLIVCKDLDSGRLDIFRKVTEDEEERKRFLEFAGERRTWVSHNALGFDIPVLLSCLQLSIPISDIIDTLIISKLVDYSRQGHSIEDYGKEFGLQKGKFSDFSKYSLEMEAYCVRDVEICSRIYSKYHRYLSNPVHHSSIALEHRFQLVVNQLHDNGFCFNSVKAQSILSKVEAELAVLDKDILEAFPPRLKLIREVHPKETKYGTLSKTDFRWHPTGDLSEFNGGSFCRCSWELFNPSSHKQIVSVLSASGWKPIDKTTTHIETERELTRLKRNSRDKSLDIARNSAIVKLEELKKTGYKVNETNLSTLPDYDYIELWLKKCRIKVPQDQLYIKENIIKSTEIENEKPRSNTIIPIKNITGTNSLDVITELVTTTLNECLKNKEVVAEFVTKSNHLWSIIVTPTDIYVDCSASFATGTWVGLRDTQITRESISRNQAAKLLAKRILLESRRRTLTEWLSLVSPQGRIHGKFYGLGAWTHRMAHQAPNTANIPNEFDTAGKKKLLGKELRSLWCAPKNRLLVGVDAEGIQLRIFAHYINDPEFTDALVKGRKDDKTDPHSLNQRILGSVCKSRAAAKRFIYALLLGAGTQKLSEILGCSDNETKQALDRLMGRYEGWATLKSEVFPTDARRGWFSGLDGRKVKIPGDTEGSRRHLAMSGYLQNGEAVCMKLATLKWVESLKTYDALLVNFVHDEWQVECPNDMEIALKIAKTMAGSLEEVGKDLKLNCPLAGSYYNDDLRDYTIDTNWSRTH